MTEAALLAICVIGAAGGAPVKVLGGAGGDALGLPPAFTAAAINYLYGLVFD
jgi:hypothetical protein